MKKSITITVFSLFIVSLFTESAYALGVESIVDLYIQIRDTSFVWMPIITQYVLWLLFFTSLIAFAIGCKDLVLNGSGLQLEVIVALFVRFAFIIGLIIWLVTNPNLLLMIPSSLAALGASLSGNEASFVTVIGAFSGLTGPIIDYMGSLQHTETGIIILCWFLVFCVHCLSVLFITTIFIVQVETILILIGGMITAAFFVIGYFRELFMSYVKALAINGLKLLLLSLCVGIMVNIISGWSIELSIIRNIPNGIFNIAIPMVAGLIAFYVILKAIIQFAVTILSGRITTGESYAKSMLVTGAATGAAIWNVFRGVSQTSIDNASAVHNASQAYMNTEQTIKDTSSAAQASNQGTWRFDAFRTNDSYNQEMKEKKV